MSASFRATFTGHSWPLVWAGYAACAWTLFYGGLQLYWVLGGQVGSSGSVATDFSFVAGWGSVVLCALGAVVALVTVRSSERWIPRWAVVIIAWSTSVLLVWASFIGRAVFLQLFDVLGLALAPNWPSFLHKTLLLGGGFLWGATALSYQRRSRGACVRCGRAGTTDGNEKTPLDAATTNSGVPPWVASIPAYAAFVLTGAYAVVKTYWSLGGSSGVGLFPRAPPHLGFVAGWGTVIVAVIAMGIALATVQSWGRKLPRWLLLGPAWIGAGFLSISFMHLDRYLGIAPLLLAPSPLMALAWIATALSYQYRTRGQCARCGRGTDHRGTKPAR